MKKIIFVLPSLNYGGLERVQVNLANALVRRGHDVTILTYRKGQDLLQFLDSRVNYIYKQPKKFKLLRKIRFVKIFYEEGMWERRVTAGKLYKYYIGKNIYDVEIGFFRGLSIKIISGSTNRKSTKLAWVHSDFLKCEGITNGFKDFQEAKDAYKTYNTIVCVSNQAANSFKLKMGIEQNVNVIYNINDINEILKKSEEKYENPIKSDFNIVSIGRLLNCPKGFDRLLEACKMLNCDGLNYSLTIVGDGVDRQMLQQYIVENDMRNVQLVGMQSNPYKYIRDAELLVCSSYYEGYNLTVAESLIIGTPVLSTNCTGPKEILGNGEYGIIVDNDTKALYSGIKDIINNKELYNYYRIKAKERMNFFDEEKIIREVERVF